MIGTQKYQFIELIFATFLISTSGVLGRYIALDPPVIIWCRSILALVALYFYCRYKKMNLKILSQKDLPSLVLSGVFMAGHWITYFYALKLSNVALAVLSLYTFPLITALLEPFFIKSKLSYVQVFLTLLILVGVYVLVPEFDLENDNFKGVLVGVFSALLYALRTLLLKRHVNRYNGTVIMFHQMLVVSVLLIPFLFFMDLSSIPSQMPYLIILAVLTTAIGHTLFVKSLRFFEVSTASIISSLQPIVGIILAFVFLSEVPASNVYLGGAIILFSVVVESIRTKNK
ncbi:MAG: DMT family transporter [Flavobacteriales bacterium]|mgnify:FL=1